MTIEKFTIPVSPPFRLDFAAWALRRRSRNRIDYWDGKRYRRVLIADSTTILALVEQNTDSELAVTLRSEGHSDGDETQVGFPRPEDLYGISADEIKTLGFSYQKARAIAELSTNIVEQKLNLSNLDASSNEEIFDVLTQIRGIGRWSAEYTLLRGFGRLDILPGDDVGAQRNLMQLMELDARPNYDQIMTLSQRWQPYAGLVYFHLLLEKLQLKGVL